MRTPAVIDGAPVGVLASVVVLGQRRPGEVFARTGIAARRVRATVLDEGNDEDTEGGNFF